MYIELLHNENDTPKLSKSDDLYKALKKDILMSDIYAGLKLTEDFICKKYKVSRTPARSALLKLENEGLCESFLNKGSFVKPLSKQDITDLFRIAIANEKLCMKWAIERITEEEIDELKQIYEFMEFYTYKFSLAIVRKANASFRMLLHSASHNHLLQVKLDTYYDTLDYACIETQYDDNVIRLLFKEHTKIYESFLSKDIETTQLAIENHLRNTYSRYYGHSLE